MKLLGGTDDRGGVRDVPARSQDDATVGYVFQRTHPHEAPEFAQFTTSKQETRWATGDDVIDTQDKWKFSAPMNNVAPVGPVGVGMGVGVGMSMQHQQQQASSKHPQMLSHQQHHNPLPSHQQIANHMHAQNHLNSAVLNHALNNPSGQGGPIPMQAMQGNIYDHVHQSVNMNGVGMPKPSDQQQQQQMQHQQQQQQQQQQPLVYLGGHLGMLAPQNQYMTATNRNAAAITASAAKKLWEKSDMKGPTTGPLGPLQLHGVTDNQVWKDSTWSTQGGETILAPSRPRAFPQAPDTNPNTSASILSPRDSTSGLGVKMVEYVLGGSPTNKESPLSSLEPRLRGLKFDDNDKTHDDKEKANSPFDTNGLKKDDQVNVTSGVVVNGIDDDKGFKYTFGRTPGSRQPSPAEESLARGGPPFDGTSHVGSGFPQHHLQHMLSSSMDHQGPNPQLNSYHPQLPPMNQLQPPVMNGVGGMQVAQNQMVNQSQGPNQVESPANLLQQPPNFDVQQLFRSQNPGLATNATAPGAPSGAPLPQPLPLASTQFLAQQNAAYAAQQATSYVINPGQEAAPYMSLIPAQVPQYYGVAAPWGVYPGNLIPQQGSQPRRPLTPSQQGAENQSYQVIPAFFDQSGSLVMGPRTGTPMRLVSPAPVLVPPGAARAPQAPQIYPPQPQQTQQSMYSTQNGSSVGGGGLFAPQAFSGGLGTLGSPAQPSGLALNTTSLSTRRDSFDRNTSTFSPSLDYNSNAAVAATTVSSAAAAAAAAAATARKWPVGNYGTLGAVNNASASPLTAPITPPPSGLVSNRAPGSENKFRNVNSLQPPVSLSAANAMFGSNSSLFSKHLPITSGAAVAAAAAAAAAAGNSVRQTAVPVDRPPGRSRLLEDFRNQRYPNLQLRELANHIVEFSQDQHGSRFIQQKLERATSAEKQMVFNEILGAAYNLMTDVFGNYVIQKFFEFGTAEQKATLANQVKGHVLPLALQMYGCRVIQKALESISSEQQQEIVKELDGHVLKCVKDQNGNHVVQKCIERVEPPSALQFIINAFKGQVYALSTHPYGCRVIQRILEHCTPEQTSPILEELHEHTEQLIQDQYGNYVIQHVLEHGKPEDKSILIAGVKGKVLVLSQHKFASNVVEKCVTHATRAERTSLIDEVCTFNDSALHVMMRDQFANYVVQKMIDVSEPTQLKKLMNKIRPHMASLRKYTYGKHINAKLEKFFMKSANPVGNALNNSAESGTGPTSAPGGNTVNINNPNNTGMQNAGIVGSNPNSNAVNSNANANGGSTTNSLGPIGPPTSSNGVL